ncbi:chitin deacetylase [Podila verticillata]|nr:chitin deacetylase [Podila verticillata]
MRLRLYQEQGLDRVVSALVVVGVSLGIYFGTKSDGDNKTGNTTNGASGSLPTSTLPTHGIGKGTTINGALFPYYVLTGETPAPSYTNELLDLLDKEDVKVTFFVNGANSMLEQALQAILGVVPRYIRPPGGDGTFGHDLAGDQKVQGTLKSLGYVITTWNIASIDSQPVEAQKAEYARVMDAAPKGASHMALHHDTHERTVKEVAPWAIRHIKSLGYKIVPVAECLGDADPRTWYKKIGPAAAAPFTTCQP